MDEEQKAGEVVTEKDELTVAREALAKAQDERDNYKKVALKRLGKLPGDTEFLSKEGGEELSVEEQVRIALLDKEVERAIQTERDTAVKLAKENAELRLALKNRPGQSLGGDGGATTESKDPTFSAAQLEALTARAKRLGADPAKFIENARKNFTR